ncbi:DNA cytosine methyltransferase [Psychroserpens luteolus]|uniref:DNA cytosine methyltransferase n=1 Tax=Psychroserpens luteolus TaxID=2855840 RepID=UPI001E626811|nr:DNA cytosine methyltransferase [Psychroserpens luteolus]MCD2260203.1 DNA cytosine methyltransferase [Psychroserpens luteolus]
MKELNFIDLFSGAGGLSEGFINAGFKPIAHVEIDKKACETLETRLVYHKLNSENNLQNYYDYISGKISRIDLLKDFSSPEISASVINIAIGGNNNKIIFETIDKLAKGKEIDLIIGGPPCQAYSLVGRSRDKNRMKNDPRNFLYKEYAKFLKKYEPKVFVFENVMGLITAKNGSYFKNMRAYFKRIGYELDFTIQKSEEFGVLQKRRRIILIGWKKGSDFKYPVFDKIKEEFNTSQIFSDLKKLKPGEQNNVTKYANKTTVYLERFELRNGVDFVTQHIARPHNERDLNIYKIAIKKWLEKTERLKYPDLPTKLKTHKNEKAFVDRFKVVDINGLSHTMVAHIAKDGHHYIYPDTKQVRSISVREAARIQSFPDDYYFEGGRTAAYRQIGNAVPPLMAKEIAFQIKKQL